MKLARVVDEDYLGRTGLDTLGSGSELAEARHRPARVLYAPDDREVAERITDAARAEQARPLHENVHLDQTAIDGLRREVDVQEVLRP